MSTSNLIKSLNALRAEFQKIGKTKPDLGEAFAGVLGVPTECALDSERLYIKGGKIVAELNLPLAQRILDEEKEPSRIWRALLRHTGNSPTCAGSTMLISQLSLALEARAETKGPQQPEKGPSVKSQQREEEAAPNAQSDKMVSLRPASRKAYLSFVWAESKAERPLSDRDAYQLLNDQGIPDGAGDTGELEDYELPDFETWTRLLRYARAELGQQKHKPRGSRTLGKSIVRADQVERLKQAED